MSSKKTFFSLMAAIMVASSVGFYSPAKAAGNYGAGSLLAAQGQTDAAVYYIGSDGKKYAFPDAKTYYTWYEDFRGVIKVSVSELDLYPDGGVVTYRPGAKLIKHMNSAKVYAVTPGGVTQRIAYIREIPSEARAIALYGSNWYNLVQDIIPGYFSSYTLGSVLEFTLPTGTIVADMYYSSPEAEGVTAYYYIENNAKRLITSSAAFKANRFNYANVITADLSNYPDGPEITGQQNELVSFMPDETVEWPADTALETTLKNLFAIKFSNYNSDTSTYRLTISLQTADHVYGSISYPGPLAIYNGAYFFAAKVDGNWKIVLSGNGEIPCELLTHYNFPASMKTQCVNVGANWQSYEN